LITCNFAELIGPLCFERENETASAAPTCAAQRIVSIPGVPKPVQTRPGEEPAAFGRSTEAYLGDFALCGALDLKEISLGEGEHTGHDVRGEHLDLVVEEQDLVVVALP